MNDQLTSTCRQAALAAYENARADGLCHDGAWECAVAVVNGCALKEVECEQLLQELWALVQA